jgi:FecR protein
MKYTGRLLNKTAVLGIALVAVLAASTGQAQSTKQGKAQVRAVSGSARYSTGGGAWMELKTGTVLNSGAVVSTAAGSHVDLYLGMNGPVVRVSEDTQMGIDKLTYTDTGADAVIETQLNLTKGTLIGSVRKLAAASRYEIKTPAGVAGIRGTDYVITHTLMLFILKGLGHVAYILPDGNILSESVSTGESFIPPGTKRLISKQEFDRWSPIIVELLTTKSADATDLKYNPIYVDPRTGLSTSPVDED